jgi:sulfite reductase alpha subunit-like flavoprotein
MEESGKELWNWIQDGAIFYVCGDASRMAKDVDATLHKIAETHGGLSAEDAAAYIKGLKKEKRYARDVY